MSATAIVAERARERSQDPRVDGVLERLLRLYPRAIDLDMGRLRVLLEKLGNPEHRLAPVLHVAGTNGKGSTCAFARAIAEAAGLRTQVYTSPHLVDFNERIRLTHGLVETAALVDALEAVERVASRADELHGGFDTWINNAGVAIFGAIADTPLDDQRRLFETNYWGVVNGCRVAVEHLKGRADGGALITVGSVLGDQAVPVQGVYSASKHAVKGFINALRMELKASAPEVSVTLIKPSAIDTPYHLHARNYTGSPKKNPPPVYSVALVAEAILHAAEHPVRQITVGGGGRLQASIGQMFPALAEPVFARLVPLLMKSPGGTATGEEDGLYKAGGGMCERSDYFGVRQTSLYTAAQMNPQRSAAVISAVIGVGLLILRVRGSLQLLATRRDAVRRYQAKLDAKAQAPQG